VELGERHDKRRQNLRSCATAARITPTILPTPAPAARYEWNTSGRHFVHRLDTSIASGRTPARSRYAGATSRRPGATIYDPRTGAANGSGRSAFPGAVIPQERISEVAKKLNQHWPVPNLTNADGSVPDFNNYFVQPRFDFNRWTIDSKMNSNATERLQIFGRSRPGRV
jgi:hypothetical protein